MAETSFSPTVQLNKFAFNSEYLIMSISYFVRCFDKFVQDVRDFTKPMLNSSIFSFKNMFSFSKSYLHALQTLCTNYCSIIQPLSDLEHFLNLSKLELYLLESIKLHQHLELSLCFGFLITSTKSSIHLMKTLKTSTEKTSMLSESIFLYFTTFSEIFLPIFPCLPLMVKTL